MVDMYVTSLWYYDAFCRLNQTISYFLKTLSHDSIIDDSKNFLYQT